MAVYGWTFSYDDIITSQSVFQFSWVASAPYRNKMRCVISSLFCQQIAHGFVVKFLRCETTVWWKGQQTRSYYVVANAFYCVEMASMRSMKCIRDAR